MTYKLSLLYNVYDQVMTEILFCFLQNTGIDLTNIIEQRSGDASGLCFFCEDKDAVNNILKEINKKNLKDVKVKIEQIQKKDWQEKWKENLEAFKITKKLRVIPFWHLYKYKINKAEDIIIDTTSSFGMGTHPTTQLMSEFIEELKGQYEDVFDIGTGTGMLAIIAKKYGAKKCWAIDIDKKSVLIAKKNMQINACKSELLKCCSFENFNKKDQFDLVIANILTKDLLNLRDKLIEYVKSKKYLVLSGIHDDNYDELRKYFDGEEITHIKTKKKNNWCAVLYRVDSVFKEKVKR
ncbi:MAG: 50S ribosomal protein L11 methyltransferase [Candidatus Omnitrophica bacterium]|nr:50S ribosomal protein L11 methyltransferase [Candidatus Omnitrophota bacterium]